MKISKDLDLLYFWDTYSQNPIPTVVISKEGKIIEYNEAMFELTGYTQEEVTDIESWMTRLYPDEEYRGKVIEISRKSRKKEIDLKRYEFIITRKDGEKRYVEFSFYKIIYEGESTDLQVIQGVDITKYKKAEEALRESEEKYRNLFENLNDAAFLIDTETGIILDANKQAELLLGRTWEEIIGMHQTELHPSDRVEKNKQTCKSCITSKKYEDSDAEVIRKDGMTIPVSISCQKLTLGVKNSVICLFRDLTDRKRAEEEDKLRQQQLIQTDKLASLGEVVAGVAHEINNPNSFITYNVPLLEETWQMFEPILKEYAQAHPEWKKNNIGFEEYLQDMNEIIYSINCGSERINEIVANLKDFAQIGESGHKKLVDINEIIKKAMFIFEAQMRKSVGHININLADNLPQIQGYFQKLEQVVANLMVNSVHAIPHKYEGKLSISTRYIDRLRSVLIEVEDNGEGIEPDLLDRIFEPFFTTRRSEGGTGLGLSVSYRLVQEHNGIIGVLSKPGIGTRFTVFLPVEEDVKYDIRPLILCVDDDEAVLKVFKRYFSRMENIFFKTTCQSEKVLEYIDEHPEVDIIISDVRMPVVDGWEILQKVKEKYPLLTVILYSRYFDALQEKEGIDVKPDYLLEKPIEFKRLELILNSITRLRL